MDREAPGENFRLIGCTVLSNFTSNMMDDYEFTPLGDGVIREAIEICDNYQYDADKAVQVLEQIAEKARKAKCFETHIDKSNKTVRFEFLPEHTGNRRVIAEETSKSTYFIEGHKPYVYRDQFYNRIVNLCVFNPAFIEAPFTDIDGI